MNIGQRIKLKREALSLTQDELAKMTGYKSRSSINKIESDGRGLPQSKIIAFAKALNTTPAYLMGWESEETENKLTAKDDDELTLKKLEFIEKIRQLDDPTLDAIEKLVDQIIAQREK